MGNFAVANTDDFAGQLPEEGLPENDESTEHPKPIVLVFGSDGKKYVMPELFSKAGFTAFLTAFLAGEVEPHIKSETPPADNDDIVIAKIDATANDSPSQFAVSGFPTIYFS